MRVKVEKRAKTHDWDSVLYDLINKAKEDTGQTRFVIAMNRKTRNEAICGCSSARVMNAYHLVYWPPSAAPEKQVRIHGAMIVEDDQLNDGQLEVYGINDHNWAGREPITYTISN